MDPLGITVSRGAETERDLKTAEEEQQPDEKGHVLDLANHPTATARKVSEDDGWGASTIVPKELVVNCSCENPVENEIDTLCEVCNANPGFAEQGKFKMAGGNLSAARREPVDLIILQQQLEVDKAGYAESRGPETGQRLRIPERITREDGRRLVKENMDKNYMLSLGLPSPSGPGSNEVSDDDEWGKFPVIPQEPWVNCSCGNPVENRGDTLCEVCKILGIRRGMEIRNWRRSGGEEDYDKDLCAKVSNTQQWYDLERKDERATEQDVESSNSGNDGNQSTNVGGVSMHDIFNGKGKEKQDMSYEKKRNIFESRPIVLDEGESTEELSPEMRMQEPWAVNAASRVLRERFVGQDMMGAQASTSLFGPAAPARTSLHPDHPRIMEERMNRHFGVPRSQDDSIRLRTSGLTQTDNCDVPQQRSSFDQSNTLHGVARGRADGIDFRQAGFALESTPTMYMDFTSQPGGSHISVSNRHGSTQPTGMLNLTDRLAKAKSERERALAARKIELPTPRPLLSFQPFKGVTESREVPVYQRPGGERGSDMEEYERWNAKAQKEQQEKDGQNPATLKNISRYTSSFRPARERRQTEADLAIGVQDASVQPLDARSEDDGASRRKKLAAAAEEYETYKLKIWEKGGGVRKEVDLRQKVEMAEALLDCVKRDERQKWQKNEPADDHQLSGQVHHSDGAQSREVPIDERDSETRSVESREAALRHSERSEREGLVLRTKVQVPQAMIRAMEKDEEWRSFA